MNKQVASKVRSLGIIPIGDAFVPADEEELTALETSLGTTLPQDYREFLKTYGASMFSEYVDFEPVQRLPLPISDTGKGHFSSFYGSRNDPFQPLVKKLETFRGRMPDTVIPIGDDSGNQICLGIKGKEQGKVYYWDHQNVHLIAESFEDFFCRLEKSENA